MTSSGCCGLIPRLHSSSLHLSFSPTLVYVAHRLFLSSCCQSNQTFWFSLSFCLWWLWLCLHGCLILFLPLSITPAFRSVWLSLQFCCTTFILLFQTFICFFVCFVHFLTNMVCSVLCFYVCGSRCWGCDTTLLLSAIFLHVAYMGNYLSCGQRG